MVLLCREKAQVICTESYAAFMLEGWLERSLERSALGRGRFLRTPTLPVEAPEVILLSAYGGVPRVEVVFSRRNLYRRDGHACQYCGQVLSTEALTLDHVVPRSQGGPRSWENIVTACQPCNGKKANLSCDEAGMYPLRLSRIPTTLPMGPRRWGVPAITIQWRPSLEGWA